MRRLARKYHKKLMTFVGLQFLFWSITGLYMVSMDIHYIHGETLLKRSKLVINNADITYDINDLLSTYPNADNIEVVSLTNKYVYRFDDDKQKRIISASDGKPLATISKTQAEAIAEFYYVKQFDEPEHLISSTKLLTRQDQKPAEIAARHLPVWQVTYDHYSSPTLYISQQTGAIVTTRHNFWRIFDWMWRFHIMDYDDGENVANWFLLLIASLSMIAALAGVLLTFYFVLLPMLRIKPKGRLS